MPWATGPGEILRHGMSLLKKDSDSNRRLSMISIDNAVELMIKTYLGLPHRITGLRIPRKEFQDISESFPQLLDALEKYASPKIVGINLGEIEWYHRLRNELYHQGNGLTVEKDKIDVYAELAKLLFESLYGEKLIEEKDSETHLLGEFMSAWIAYERVVKPFPYGTRSNQKHYINTPEILHKNGALSTDDLKNFHAIEQIRNKVVHGQIKPEDFIDKKVIDFVKYITSLIVESKDKWDPE
jgi:hypothetical protein